MTTPPVLVPPYDEDAYRGAGLDAGAVPELPPAFVTLVRCPADLHDIPEGSDCLDCLHFCEHPNDPACPGRSTNHEEE